MADSYFDFATPNVIAIHEDDRIDNTSTGSYDVANNLYKLDNTEFLLSIQSYMARFLSEQRENLQVELMAMWDTVPTVATYQVSQDGGTTLEAVTMEQVGSSKVYRGVKVLTTPAGVDIGYPVANADNNTAAELNATTRQSYAAKLTTVASGVKRRVVTGSLYVNKIGSPIGELIVKVVGETAGAPNTTVYGQNKVFIDIGALSAGVNTVNFEVPAIMPAGDYWIVVETSAAYKSAFVASTTAIVVRTDASAPTYAPGNSYQYDGTTWSIHTGFSAVFALFAFNYDLRVKITATTGSGNLVGYGILHGESQPKIYDTEQNIQRFDLDGDLDVTELTITKFIPDAMKAKLYVVNSGQVLRFPAFAVDGRKIIVSAGQFLSPGNTITVLVDQAEQGAFDNSDVNGNLLASNGLGSEQGEFDRSSPGVGIKLRSPDGQLWHITVTNAGAILTTAL